MEKERRFPRFSKQREGSVFTTRGWVECIIVDMSRKGICFHFPETEKIPVGSTVALEIPAFKDLKPIHLEGTLKWSKKEDSHFVGGVELNDSLYEYEWIKLRDHFNLATLQREKPVHTY